MEESHQKYIAMPALFSARMLALPLVFFITLTASATALAQCPFAVSDASSNATAANDGLLLVRAAQSMQGTALISKTGTTRTADAIMLDLSRDGAKLDINGSGAFLDAIVIMNSSMRAHAALTAVDAQTTNIAAAELGAILNIALKQAVTEYHCVEGKLPLSYAQNYGDTLRSAIATAKRMRVSKSTIESADGLLAQLDLAASVQRTK
jgi:hypothetical protein